ncbi:hypothetical protein [Bradyrhizobium sp. LMTR 3]|uniref:hypothetical protein n=1 Tax=Bradyrhizobium sp. LMTR 3 TaxID=189873 RepID=UPI000810D673|nr:hypothetical protein [Bradyrhizobium sp. LMTR 3]OCK60039.1 hypothetical protein LMTR3_20860 [Bradyrhizobium sp. LMTR 3]
MQQLMRLETQLLNGLENDAGARAAVLGTLARPSFPLSKLFDEYQALTKDETAKLSPNQLRVWRNSHIRAVKELVDICGDKVVTELSDNDGLDYAEWQRNGSCARR